MQTRLGLDTTSSGTEETLVDEWLNQGVVDVLLRTRCHVNCADIALTSGEWKYTLDTDILAINDISCSTGELYRVDPAEIMRMRTYSPSDSDVRYYALNGNDLFMIYPTPESAEELDCFYVPRPTAMSATGNDPSAEAYGGIPSEYHHAIVLYALAQGSQLTDHNISKYGTQFLQEYEQWIYRIKKAIRAKGGRYLGAAHLGRRKPVPSNPSADWGY